MKHVGDLLGMAPAGKYDSSVHYDRTVHHNDAIGVEIEFEGAEHFNDRNSDAVWSYWNMHEDGSLRGNGRELVFRRPHKGDDVVAALAAISGRLDKCSFSARTSVHVHLDVRDITSPALYRLFLLYVVVEELLFDVCGKHRANNNFCLSTYHANGALDMLARLSPTQCIRSLHGINTAEQRYAAMNLDAVRKFGSLEFRGHEGTPDTTRIALWINLLTHMKHYAVRTRDMEALLTQVSTDGPRLMLADCFPGELYDHITSGGGDVYAKLLRGARRAQDVLISRDLQEANADLIETIAPTPKEKDRTYWDVVTPAELADDRVVVATRPAPEEDGIARAALRMREQREQHELHIAQLRAALDTPQRPRRNPRGGR